MDLKEILDEELYNQVQDQLENAAEEMEDQDELNLIVNDGSFIPRDRLNDKNDKIEALQEKIEARDEQIEQRDQQIEDLKNDTQMTEELKEKIESYEQENKELKNEKEELVQEKEQEIKQQKKARAIEVELAGQTNHPDLLMNQVDFEDLNLNDDGEIKGVSDVVENLKENYEDLFIEETIEGPGGPGDGDNPTHSTDPSEMSDAKYFKAVENGDIEV